jgi:hypothetical protein
LQNKGDLDLSSDEKFNGCSFIVGHHTKLESTVRYLGIEVEDAFEISEQTEI